VPTLYRDVNRTFILPELYFLNKNFGLMKALLFIIPLTIVSYSLYNHWKVSASPVIIQGKVVAKQSNVPVQQAYIHITAGEEEAITAKDGSFIIKTWQSLPVECTVEHKDFIKRKMTITDNNNLIIVLQAK